MHDWPCSWAGPGFSRVLPSPTNSLSRKGPIRGSQRRKPWIGIQQRKHYQHPHASEAPDKGQEEAKNGREDGRMSPVFTAFTVVCHYPEAGPSA